MAGKGSVKIGFEKQIWDAACVLWGHIPAAEYRKVIIGLIFLRYISASFEKRYNELLAEGDGFENDKDAYSMENIFFVPESARWSTIAEAAHTPEIGKVIDDAMRAIEAENKALKNVLPKNYASPDLDKRVLGEVVDLFTNEVNMEDIEDVLPDGVQKNWDDDLKQYYVEYQDGDYTRKMWIEDLESLKAKVSLVHENNLAGVASWQKGMETDDVWPMLKEELEQ